MSIPDRSSTRSPTGSIRTIQSISSTATSQSGTGSASTVYVPPLDELSDIQSLSGSSSLSRRQSLASAHRARATDDGAISSQGYVYPGDPRVIPPSRSSSLRRTSSMTDLDEEFASALRRARESRPGLGFGLGLAGGVSTGGGSPVTVSSGPRLGGNVYMSPPPSVADRRSRGSETSSSVSDDVFFSASSTPNSRTPTSSYYSSSSFTRGLTCTGSDSRTGTGLITDESIEFTSGSGTNIVTSTLSYRGTDSASLLGDSHSGSSAMHTAASLTRSGGVRRRTPRAARMYTTSSSEEISDRENTCSGAYTYTLSTLESLSRTGTTPTMSRSRSVTPTPSSLSYARSTEEEQLFRSDSEEGSVYYNARAPRSPSTASFKSLSTIPSLSDYETALIVETEYETAPRCESEVAGTEFETVPPCETPAPTEYITAPVCESEVSTEFRTVDYKRVRVPESDVVSITAPSEIPTIPSSAPSPVPREIELELELEPEPIDVETEPELLEPEYEPEPVPFEPADVPLPPSSYTLSEPSEHTPTERAPSPTTLTPTSPTEPSLELMPTLPPSESISFSTPSSVELSSAQSPTESIPGPSPIPSISTPSVSGPSMSSSVLSPSDLTPSSDTTPSSLTVPSPTESSVTPTPSSQVTPTVPSTLSQPSTISSSPRPDSAWGVETDESYVTSFLRASPSIASLAIPEGPDISYDTTQLRPSDTRVTSDESSLSLMTPISDVSPSSPVVESAVSLATPPSDVSPSSPATEPSPPSSELTPTQSTISLLPTAMSPAPVPREFPIPAVTLSRTPSTMSSVSSVSMSSSRIVPSEFEFDVRTEPSLLSTPSSEAIRLPEQAPQRPPSVRHQRPLSENGLLISVSAQALPLFVPLPPSPSPSLLTPSASMRLSMSTPRGDTPSIASNIETIASDAPSHILTHDVNRLLQYLNDINEARGAENKEMADNIQDIKGTLEDLEALLRERMFPDQPPPVPHKDMSVGGSSVISSAKSALSTRSAAVSARSRSAMAVRPSQAEKAISATMSTPRSARSRGLASERSTPVIRPEVPRIMRAISISPPPLRRKSPPSPDSLSETMSFLSSHHSDDLSLMESESYPMGLPASPSWPSSSPISSPESSTSSSPTSAPPSSITPSEQLSSISDTLHVPVHLARSPTPTPPPLSSSPSPSTISTGTARPIQAITLSTLRDGLDAIRQQIAAMREQQDATNQQLDDLRSRPREAAPPPQTIVQPIVQPSDRWDEFSRRLGIIEDSILRLLEYAVPREAPRPAESLREPSVREGDAESSVHTDWRAILEGITRSEGEPRAGEPVIYAPTPQAPRPSFDEQLMEILMAPPQQTQTQVHPPPPLIPLIYRPGPRARPRSSSPETLADLPERPRTVPIPIIHTVPASSRPRQPTRPPVVRDRFQPAPAPPSEAPPSEMGSAFQPDIQTVPGPMPAQAGGPSGEDWDFLREVQRRRAQRTGTDGHIINELVGERGRTSL